MTHYLEHAVAGMARDIGRAGRPAGEGRAVRCGEHASRRPGHRHQQRRSGGTRQRCSALLAAEVAGRPCSPLAAIGRRAAPPAASPAVVSHRRQAAESEDYQDDAERSCPPADHSYRVIHGGCPARRAGRSIPTPRRLRVPGNRSAIRWPSRHHRGDGERYRCISLRTLRTAYPARPVVIQIHPVTVKPEPAPAISSRRH